MKIYTGKGWEVRCGKWEDDVSSGILWSAGDCRSGGKRPESVDVIVSDPPYDERTHKGGRNKQSKGLAGVLNDLNPGKSFAPISPADVGPPLLALSTRWVVLFCAAEQLGAYQAACNSHYVRGGVWVKPGPQPQLSGDRPGQWGDGVAILHPKGKKRWNGGGHAAHWRHQQVRHDFHETQKPLNLMLELVSLFSDPDELVWDPYCGSGTTGVACLRLGRRFLGHEMQPHYAQIAAERLAAEERGLTLQDVKRGQTSILDVLDDD
jgi:site-specific DNA-methyltransferase (adenine-specific)